jgi:DNA processing protein
MSATELLAMCRVVTGASWQFLARAAQKPGGLEALLETPPTERSADATEALRRLRDARDELPAHRVWVEELLAATTAAGIRLTTVLDDDYPANLRLIHNLPPFLFYRGELRPDDARAVAVVGTRNPTPDGVQRARQLATRLTAEGVVVLSGLARGIDTAAHEAALEAGGRTIAVLGTGITRTYPPENKELAERIAASGALVSQFWPDTPPRQDTFPRRNVVMSGLGQGTVVVEASATSGAKMQARFALEHGKRVFLLASLVRERPWARSYLDRGAVEVTDTERDIIQRLRSPEAIQEQSEQRRQLSLALH